MRNELLLALLVLAPSVAAPQGRLIIHHVEVDEAVDQMRISGVEFGDDEPSSPVRVPTDPSNTITTLDSTGDVGRFTSITTGADGLGLIRL